MSRRTNVVPSRLRPTRREFVAAASLATVATTATAAAPSAGQETKGTSFELSELSLDDLQRTIENGDESSHSLVEKYISQIKQLDGRLGSVVEINPDAHQIAERMDRERRVGKTRGPLHGIPVMIKDNIDSADRMKTTAGSLALVDAPAPPEDAFVVQRLRDAGAVLLGKTNLSEWANIRSSNSTSGWSARGGQTNNPYALDRNPCGSSSGSAAAVAASLCPVSVGTETDGSILCPSACCGIVGIKPTVGLISRSGIIPVSQSQDTAGPMARTVRDAAVLLGVLAGVDPRDEATAVAAHHVYPDYTKFLDMAGLYGARIGVARNFFHFHEGVDAVLAAALAVMKSEGATLIDTEHLSLTADAGEAEDIVLQYELKLGINAYLARLGPESPVQTLDDVIAFNERNEDREMPFFGQDVFLQAASKGPLDEYEYVEARAKCLRLTRTEGMDAVLRNLELDCLVAPTISLPCMTDPVNGDHWLGASTGPAAIAGYASITVPAGYVYGLPVGLSFFAGAWSEPTLLKLAFAFEQASNIRQPPTLLPSVDLAV